MEIFILGIGWLTVFALIISGLILGLIGQPGGLLIWGGFLISGFIDDFQVIDQNFLVVTFVIVILTTLIDNLLLPYSSKYFGGSKWAVFGVFIGMIVGFFIGGFVGLFLAPLFSTLLFEVVLGKNELKSAMKVGVGVLSTVLLIILFRSVISIALLFWWASRLI